MVWSYPRMFMAEIIAEVSHVFQVSEAALKGRCRLHRVALPRHICAYLGRQLTPLSYPTIGRALGGRDHSTIIHARENAEKHITSDAELRAYVDAVRIRLLTTRERAEQREREAMAVKRERERREAEAAEREAQRKAEAAAVFVMSDDDLLSRAVASFVAAGGSFVEVRA